MSGPTVGIFVDYESALARAVAGRVWSGLSAAALVAGYPRISALWESLREDRAPGEKLEGPLLHVFVVGQDRPDAVDAVAPVGEPDATRRYGMVVAVPPRRPSPLAGPLLYQGVEKLVGRGVKAGLVEPAPLRAVPGECELYAAKLLGRLRKARGNA